MPRISAFLFLFPLAVSLFGQETAVGTSTVTFGVGGGFTGDNPYGTTGGPVFNGTYEYRIWKYLAVEAGVHNTLVTQYSSSSIYTPITIGAGLSTTTVLYGSTLSYRSGARNTSVPFGFRGILPLKHGKVELFLGGDGAYIWNANQGYQAWAVEGRLGARFALDKQRRFWLGTTGEFLHEFDTESESQHWTTWTADFSYRFGK